MSDDLIKENAELRRRLDTCMHAGDMEHARMASLIGASTDLLNQLALLTRDDSAALWRIGGNGLQDASMALKRATAAVRPQADALLALLADLSRQIGEQNMTIGYQDAMLRAAYHALQSYAHGNSVPDLAIEVAGHLQQAVEKARET